MPDTESNILFIFLYSYLKFLKKWVYYYCLKNTSPGASKLQPLVQIYPTISHCLNKASL